jgi:hypothetical protein
MFSGPSPGLLEDELQAQGLAVCFNQIFVKTRIHRDRLRLDEAGTTGGSETN